MGRDGLDYNKQDTHSGRIAAALGGGAHVAYELSKLCFN